jgi:DNA-binding NarL/FixJ family response regulator
MEATHISRLAEGPREEAGATLTVNRITVLIADDHPVVIGGIRRALDGHDDIDVVGEAHSAPEVLEMIERRRPRFVLLDLNMPGVAGLDCVEQIVARWPQVKVIILSACEDSGMINGAFAAGAIAYIFKSVMTMDVASVLRQASTGGIFHAATGQRGTAREVSPMEPQAGLTAREQTILTAVTQGLTTAAISQQLWVSEHTVKFHLTNIYRKLGVANRAAAVRYALEHRLVAD